MAITGAGVVSPAGRGRGALSALAYGPASAIGPVHRYRVDDATCRVAGLVPDGLKAQLLAEAGLPDDDLVLAMARAAVAEALAESGLSVPFRRPARVGVWIGTTTGGLDRWERYRQRGAGPEDRLDRTGYAAPAEWVARQWGIRGPVMAVTTACTSSALAVALARDALLDGTVDVALAGGADALCRFAHGGFEVLRALSPGRLRPFGLARDGLQLGEASAVLVLERERSVRRRGGSALAWVAGCGNACDATHPTAPRRDGRGVEDAVRAALRDSGLGPDDVSWVDAHATGTVYNDAMEAQALGRVFGGRPVPLHATKAHTGHTLGTAGALEIILGLESFARRQVPPTLADGPFLPDLAGRLVVGGPSPLSRGAFLSTNSAFAGSNAAVVLGPPSEPPP